RPASFPSWPGRRLPWACPGSRSSCRGCRRTTPACRSSRRRAAGPVKPGPGTAQPPSNVPIACTRTSLTVGGGFITLRPFRRAGGEKRLARPWRCYKPTSLVLALRHAGVGRRGGLRDVPLVQLVLDLHLESGGAVQPRQAPLRADVTQDVVHRAPG